MSAEQQPKQNGGTASCVNMESVHRIAQLPVVESTIQTATNIYGKVKVMCDPNTWPFFQEKNSATRVYDHYHF